MTKPIQEQFFSWAPGKAMNRDGVAGLQCVDVPNEYAEMIFGDWEKSIGRGDAWGKFYIAPVAFWDKVSFVPGLIPQRGDVIVWPGSPIVSAGHTAVVTTATKDSITVIEQSGGTNRPAYISTHPYKVNGVWPTGWLRPKQSKMKGSDMFVYARSITPLEVTLPTPIMMYNVETGSPLWTSGYAMRLVAKTNIVHGSTFYIPVDRAANGEAYGFREEDVYRKGNVVKEVVQASSGLTPEDRRKLDLYEEAKRLFSQ